MSKLRDILTVDDRPTTVVDTPEWGPFGVPTVTLRGLSAAERDKYEQSLSVTNSRGERVPRPNLRNIRASFVALCIVDDDGELAFTDRKDVEKLGERNAQVIDRLWKEARRISGMLTLDEEEQYEEESGQPDPFDEEEQPSSSGDSDSSTESQTQTSSVLD